MKTLTDLLRHYVTTRRKTKKEGYNAPSVTADGSAHETNNILSTLKPEEDEKENPEDPGIPGMAHPAAQETDSDCQKSEPERHVTEPRSQDQLQGEPSSHLSSADLQRKIEAAYRQGIIEGRNQRIEEIHFPKSDDGIPHFHGSPAKGRRAGDIFSMAREA